jgi:Protein of unknown function (DUF3078)
MKQIITLFFALFCLISFNVQAQDAKPEELGWTRGGGLGFDLSGLGIANPRVGAGLNRFGLGGLGTFFANKKAEKSFWENGVSLQLGVVRLGGSKEPFTKNIDVLRLQSKAGYSITANKKWYASGLLIGTTSLLKTYEGNLLDGQATSLFSQFLAPAQIQFHPGIEWRPNDHFSALFSPVGLNLIYVGNDALAARNIHGNEFGKNNRTQLVPSLNLAYKNKFLNERITYTSTMNLTTDYLNNPFTITALNFWQNNISIAIFKGLSLDLFGEAAYDHYKPVQIDGNNDGRIELGTINPITRDGEIPTTTGLDRLGFGTQFTGAFLLKYNKIF